MEHCIEEGTADKLRIYNECRRQNRAGRPTKKTRAGRNMYILQRGRQKRRMLVRER